jgi:hypothetical protein
MGGREGFDKKITTRKKKAEKKVVRGRKSLR